LIGYLGLGSNVGDRLAPLRAAVDSLRARGLVVLASSSVYETEPVGEVLDQRDFYNACLQVKTELGAEELLDLLKEVEGSLGREPGGPRHGPRPIDIDLLLLGSLELDSPRLVLPHPSIAERRFVLVPLLELEPGLRLPGVGGLRDALAALGEGQSVRRVAEPLL
jgi:2-amino-4-hydroxy-6-hydroxymethyldihydropteridine diphosphokinase